MAIKDNMPNLSALADSIRTKSGCADIENTLPELKLQVDNLTLAGNIQMQSKIVTPTEDTQTVVADDGYDGLDNVTVNPIPDTYEIPELYDGSTDITPTSSPQTLPTAGKKLTTDIIVEASAGNPADKEMVEHLLKRDLTDIVLPDYIDTIGKNVFKNYSTMVSINLNHIKTIADGALYAAGLPGELIIPNNIESIGSGAFEYNNMTSLILPGKDIIKNMYIFAQCKYLKDITLQNGIVTIGYQAFMSTIVENIIIPATVNIIGGKAFYDCKKLTEVIFTGTPTTINTDSFGGCPALTSIKVPWAVGAVAGAPWGATNATITYNYTGDDTNADS